MGTEFNRVKFLRQVPNRRYNNVAISHYTALHVLFSVMLVITLIVNTI